MRSFDVFDTVLTRAVGDPGAVITLVADRLTESGVLSTGPAFARARHTVEGRLLLLGGRPPSLREIHEEVAATLGLEPRLAVLTEQAELEAERRLSRAVPGAREALTAARGDGDVIFVSDTPFPATFLRELLAAAGLWEPGDRVWSSADAGVSKKQGGLLFLHVAKEIGLPPEHLHHTGDHPLSDVAEARLHGWSATLAPAGRLNRYERLLESEADASAGLSSQLAGASRLARLRARQSGVPAELAAVAAGVAAPLLVGYALWLLRQSALRGIHHLYFLAHGGEALLEVVRPLARALASDVELHPLYGSSAAWHLAKLHGRDDELTTWLLSGAGASVATVLQRVGLSSAVAYELVPDELLAPERADRPLRARELARLGELLCSEQLHRLVLGQAAARHDVLLEHLRQQGLDRRGSQSAVVDLDWVGGTSLALERVMRSAGMPPVAACFYVGLSAGGDAVLTEDLRGRQHAFLFDHVGRRGLLEEASGTVALVQAFCGASQGGVVGHGGEVGPALRELIRDRNDDVVPWALSLRTTVADVVAQLADGVCVLDRPADLRGAIDAVLRAFWVHPTPAEVQVWSKFPAGGDAARREDLPLAASVSTTAVVRGFRSGRPLRPPTPWRAGTAQLSSLPWRQLLRFSSWYERHGARLARVPRRVRLEVARRHRR